MQGAGCRVQGAGSRVQGPGSRVQGQGAGCRGRGRGRVQGAGTGPRGPMGGSYPARRPGGCGALLVHCCRVWCVVGGSELLLLPLEEVGGSWGQRELCRGHSGVEAGRRVREEGRCRRELTGEMVTWGK